MNNLPLQPLPWESVKYSGGAANDAQGAGIYYRAIQRDGKHIVYWVDSMGGSDGDKSFDSWDELKEWVETTHYPHKMQPYVKPMPTWIDASEREPNEKGDYLIRDYQGRVAMGKYDKGFYMESGGEKWGYVQFWMPIPEFSTMQNFHKGGDCE